MRAVISGIWLLLFGFIIGCHVRGAYDGHRWGWVEKLNITILFMASALRLWLLSCQ